MEDKNLSKAEKIKVATAINALLTVAASKECILCGQKAIKAHAISKKMVLDKIADKGKVFSSSYNSLNPFTVTFSNEGTGKVSTFSAFCGKHDQQLFRQLDEHDYVYQNEELEFKLAFRSYVRAYWHTLTEFRSSQLRIDAVATKDLAFIYKYVPIDRIYQSHVTTWIEARNEAMQNLMGLIEIISSLKRDLAELRWDATLLSHSIKLQGEYPIAASGHCEIQCECTNSTAFPKFFAFNIFPQNGSTYAVFTIPRVHAECLVSMLTAISTIGARDFGGVITHILVQSHSDALAINPDYWSKLPSKAKEEFMEQWRGSTHDKIGKRVDLIESFTIFEPRLIPID